MNILLPVIIGLIVIGHTATAVLDGVLCRVLACVTILLHPLALIPMLLLKLPFEAVALLFLSSALYYMLVTLAAARLKRSRTSSDEGGGEA